MLPRIRVDSSDLNKSVRQAKRAIKGEHIRAPDARPFYRNFMHGLGVGMATIGLCIYEGNKETEKL